MFCNIPADSSLVEDYLSRSGIDEFIKKYEMFIQSVIGGELGPTAQFWATYVYMINRLHRNLQRCIKTNDVQGYIHSFQAVLEVFFALNRPNYARWGTLFLQELRKAGPEFREILERGAFTIRRTKKNYSRSAVDLSLEQTINRDAFFQLEGHCCLSKL